ncbi:hypothetical protein ACFYOA_26345 [Streptomyces iakyrus]|uniref:hypothetical protein n=1 Tax=Streptomyces iakyrus TaxID=68219 RepID=UPI0036C9F4C2
MHGKTAASWTRRSGGRPPDPDLGAVGDPGLAVGAEVVDDLGHDRRSGADTSLPTVHEVVTEVELVES